MGNYLNEEDSRILMNQLSHEATLRHHEELNNIHERRELSIVSSYGLTPYKDGDQWCVLLGNNIQEGICGFGESPALAVADFNRNWTSKL